MTKPTAAFPFLPHCFLFAVLAGGATLLAAHVQSYPLPSEGSHGLAAMSAPDPLKLLAMLRTLAAMARIDPTRTQDNANCLDFQNSTAINKFILKFFMQKPPTRL